MCYGDPVKLLAQFLEANPLVKDARGFTVLDDFDHLCAYSGLAEADELSIAWGRYSYVSASYSKRQAGAPPA
jgi:hypothetical protein